MTKALRFILGDQLSADISCLRGIAPDDVVLMCEVCEEATYVRHHKKKIAFLFSAMRHFAEELGDAGHTLDYVRFEACVGSFTDALSEAARPVDTASMTVSASVKYSVG